MQTSRVGEHIVETLINRGVAATLHSVTRPIASIEQELRALSTSDKEGLLRVLLEELDGAPDADAEMAWLAEVQRRSAEIEAGTVKGVSADEIFETIEATLKK
jgi:putative addiction module component (TIGR02574 family)